MLFSFRACCAALLVAIPALSAQAACSRPITVPVSPLGVSVIVSGDQVGGVFPSMLEELGARVGCAFVWRIVPRARAEAMFADGRADLLVAATHSPRRDSAGVFIPLVASRASLVSVEKGQPPVHSLAQLRQQRAIRVALVRGYDYGPAYQELSRALRAQQRLVLEPDPLSIARLLDAGMADATILPSTSVVGASITDARIADLQKRLRVEPLDELPWSQGGIYVSTKSLSAADRAVLTSVLQDAAHSGALYQGYFRYFSPAVVDGSTRPL